MRVFSGFAALLLVLACGRTPMLGQKVRDTGTPRRDAASGTDASEAGSPDARTAEVRPMQPDTSSPMTCAALASLAARGPLTARHAKQVLFAQDRSSVVLRVAGTDAGPDNEVLVAHLPQGEISSLGSKAATIDWVEGGSRVLVRSAAGDLVAFSLDGKTSTTLAGGVCGHLTSPDGNRVLILEDCQYLEAALVSVDPRTGVRSKLGRVERNPNDARPKVVFSPSGAWLAYVEPSPALDGSAPREGVIHVVDRQNTSYALTSSLGDFPVFASDNVLLFSSSILLSWPTTVDVRAHVLGNGDTSQVIAKGVAVDGFGHRVSPDGQWMLGAIIPLSSGTRWGYALAAYSVDGREIALAGDLFPFGATQATWYSFAFAADNRHVVYLTADSAGTAVVASSGGRASSLSPERAFVIPPTGNLVALTETRAPPMRIRLTDLDTTQDVASAGSTTSLDQVTFTPDGRSVVFIEQGLGSTPARLRHLSGRTGVNSELAKWNVNQLSRHTGYSGAPEPGYPLDPTGCFTIVDSDLSGGTSLFLLPEADRP